MVARVKDGVLFTVIAPGGFRILAAIDYVASTEEDLTITSACDGHHSGPDDPHHSGEAYDVRSKDLANKQKVVDELESFLGAYFYVVLEGEGTDNEHIHIQVAKGATFPPNNHEQVSDAATGEN